LATIESLSMQRRRLRRELVVKALAGPPRGPQAVENGRRDVDEESVVLTKPQRRILGQRRAESECGG
jgi:hypothetical protein